MLRRRLLLGTAAAGALAAFSIDRACADTLDEVKKRGTIIVGMEAEYVPYEFIKDGNIVGYDPDLIDIFVKDLAVKAQLIDTAWSGIIPALYAGKFDCIISGMTITKERSEKVLFSMPYAEATNVIMVLTDNDEIKAPEDLSGKKVGVTLGSAAAVVIQKYQEKLTAAGKPGYAEVKQYEHYPEAYQDMINKRIDAVVNSKSTLLVVMKDAPGKFKLIPGIQDITAYFGMAFRKDGTKLLDFVNAQLGKLKGDGTLAKLQEKWFGMTMETPNTVPEILP
jgi:polar amino acid transport system substrate-binding protein